MQWMIRNTFLDIVVPEESEKTRATIKRSSSESSLQSPATAFSFGIHAEPFVFPAEYTQGMDVTYPRQFKHVRVDTHGSTNSTKSTSEDDCVKTYSSEDDNGWMMTPTDRIVWGDDPPIDQFLKVHDVEQKQLPRKQLIFPRSYGEYRNLTMDTKSEQESASQAPDLEDPSPQCEPCAFDMVESLEFYWDLVEVCAKGVDARDAIGDVSLDKYLPLDDQGQQMSLGSIPHLCHSIGKECKPCSCYPRGKCYRGKSCMHCHFYHPLKERNRPDVMKKRRAARNKHEKQIKNPSLEENEVRIQHK